MELDWTLHSSRLLPSRHATGSPTRRALVTHARTHTHTHTHTHTRTHAHISSDKKAAVAERGWPCCLASAIRVGGTTGKQYTVILAICRDGGNPDFNSFAYEY
jgi:hypothetical protein